MHVIEWPQISITPIDEFHTEGYFTMAFPCLFPTGSGCGIPRLEYIKI